MQDTCIYQAPVEVGELWIKKKECDTPFSECSVFYYYYSNYVFVALKKNTYIQGNIYCKLSD